MTYRYPYIADKTMYAAVMGACSYIRKSGYFNKAVRYYANKYNVDEDELARHIRERQSCGQKGNATPNKGKRYKWFIVCQTTYSDADPEVYYSNPQVLKGISCESVVKRFGESDWKRTIQNDYGGSYAPVYGHKAIAQFDTETEANNAMPHWEDFIKVNDYD